MAATKLETKIKMAILKAGISQTELAHRLGTSSSALSQRIKNGKFTQEDMERIAEALNMKWTSYFDCEDGTKI